MTISLIIVSAIMITVDSIKIWNNIKNKITTNN